MSPGELTPAETLRMLGIEEGGSLRARLAASEREVTGGYPPLHGRPAPDGSRTAALSVEERIDAAYRRGVRRGLRLAGVPWLVPLTAAAGAFFGWLLHVAVYGG